MTHEIVCRYVVGLAPIKCCSNLGTVSAPRHHALTLLPLHTAITLSHPLQGYIAQCSVISLRSSTTLNITHIEQPHYNHSQEKHPLSSSPSHCRGAATQDRRVRLSMVVSWPSWSDDLCPVTVCCPATGRQGKSAAREITRLISDVNISNPTCRCIDIFHASSSG